MMIDMKANYVAAHSFTPQTITGNTPGSAVDLDGCERGFAVLSVGAVSGFTSLDVALKESDTAGGVYAALPVPVAFPQVTAASKVHVVNLRPSKRYVRAEPTLVGTNAVVTVTVLGLRKNV